MSKNVEHIRPVSEKKPHKRQSMTRSTEKQEAATTTETELNQWLLIYLINIFGIKNMNAHQFNTLSWSREYSS